MEQNVVFRITGGLSICATCDHPIVSPKIFEHEHTWRVRCQSLIQFSGASSTYIPQFVHFVVIVLSRALKSWGPWAAAYVLCLLVNPLFGDQDPICSRESKWPINAFGRFHSFSWYFLNNVQLSWILPRHCILLCLCNRHDLLCRTFFGVVGVKR